MSLALVFLLGSTAQAQKFYDKAKKVTDIWTNGEKTVKPVGDTTNTVDSAQQGQVLDTTFNAASTATGAADAAKTAGEGMVKGATYLKDGSKAATTLTNAGNAVVNNGLVKGGLKYAGPLGTVTNVYTGGKKMAQAIEEGDKLGFIDGALEATPYVNLYYVPIRKGARCYRDVYKASAELADAQAEANESEQAVERKKKELEAQQARKARAKAADANSGVSADQIECGIPEEGEKLFASAGDFPEPATNFGVACIQHGQAANRLYLDHVKKSGSGIRAVCEDGRRILSSSVQNLQSLDANNSVQAANQAEESARLQGEAIRRFEACLDESDAQIKYLQNFLYGRQRMSFDNIATESIGHRRQVLSDTVEEKERSRGQRTARLANLEERYKKYLFDTRGLVNQTSTGKSKNRPGMSICSDNAIYTQQVQNEIKRIRMACVNHAKNAKKMIESTLSIRRPFESTANGNQEPAGVATAPAPAPASVPQFNYVSSGSNTNSSATISQPSARDKAFADLQSQEASFNADAAK